MMKCDTHITLTTLLAVGISSNARALEEPDYNLAYDPGTGGLFLTGVDDGLVNYVIESDVGAFIETPDPGDRLSHRLVVSEVEVVPGVFVILGTSASTPQFIAESNMSANDFPSPGESRFIGNLLPLYLLPVEYEQAISSATYVTRLGEPIRDFNLLYVPEPGSLALVGLGGTALLRRRRAR